MSTQTTGRFDPSEGENYGVCETCGIALKTSEDAAAHRKTTFEESTNGRSHSTIGTNRTRDERIQSHVDGVVESAISDALDELQGDIDRGDLTEHEVLEALGWHSPFADAWKAGN